MKRKRSSHRTIKAAVIVGLTVAALLLSSCGDGPQVRDTGEGPAPEDVKVAAEAESLPEPTTSPASTEAGSLPEPTTPPASTAPGNLPEPTTPPASTEAGSPPEPTTPPAPAEAENPPALTPPLTIVCAGDSITYGDGVKETRETEAWPFVLQSLFDEAGYTRKDNRITVINEGVCGKTLMSTADKPYVSTDEYRDGLDRAADVYLIMFGTNDAKTFNWDQETFERELPVFLQSYIDAQTGAGRHPCLYVMIPPAVFPVNGNEKPYGIEDGLIADQIAPLIVKTAEEINALYAGSGRSTDQDQAAPDPLTVIDLHTLTAGHPDWFADGVHPNAEGNAQIAAFLYQTLGEVLPDP